MTLATHCVCGDLCTALKRMSVMQCVYSVHAIYVFSQKKKRGCSMFNYTSETVEMGTNKTDIESINQTDQRKEP